MLDTKTFGDKLKNHRKNLNMTQEQVAEKIGISAQAVSKWENGDCLPDCFNLKALGELYGLSLDILLETEAPDNIDTVAAKIEQIADEFIWTKANRDAANAHRDLMGDLWKMWKGIYFIEIGNKEQQEIAKKNANLRICSPYGLKIWDDDGVACVVQSALREKMGAVDDSTLDLLQVLCSKDGLAIVTALDTTKLTPKQTLVETCGVELHRLNELLLRMMEEQIIEFITPDKGASGYKLCGHFGISAYMVMAAAYILSKKRHYSVSEYIEYSY